MPVFLVSANVITMGVFIADTEQAARDQAAVMAGYRSEADMVAQLEQPSELVAKSVSDVAYRAARYFNDWAAHIDADAVYSRAEWEAMTVEQRIEIAERTVAANA